MNNLEKETLFLDISNGFENKAEIKAISQQSIQIMLPCGCKQTQNLFCGKPSANIENPNYELWQSIRFQFFEFCSTHFKT